MSTFFVCLLFAALRLTAQRFEAEEGTILDPNGEKDPNSVNASIVLPGDSGEITGYSGGGYVELNNGGIKFNVNVEAGVYDLVVSNINNRDGRAQYFTVDGKDFGQITFPETANQSEFETFIAYRKLNLTAGAHTIIIQGYWGDQLIDYIEFIQHTPTTVNIKADLVNANANDEAKKLYKFLKDNFGTKVISGVMTLQGGWEFSLKEPNWLNEIAGVFPGLMGLDFMHQTGKGFEWYFDDPVFKSQVVCDAEYYYSRGGIVHLMWHWRDPSKTTQGFYSPDQGKDVEDMTNFNASNAAISGSTEYNQLIADLDVVAGQLKELQNKGVAVLWRPFHEAAGRWFWWGYEGPEPLKKLWKIMYERFTDYHHLNNLIWVWTSQAGADKNWYPGDNYVDIVGADIYIRDSPNNHDSYVSVFEQLKALFEGKKIIALSECDSVPTPRKIVTDDAYWSFFMPWYGFYTTDYNVETFWKTTLTDPIVLNLDNSTAWASTPTPVCAPPGSSASLNTLNFFYFLCLFVVVLFI